MSRCIVSCPKNSVSVKLEQLTSNLTQLDKIKFTRSLEPKKSCQIKRAIYQNKLDRFTQQRYPIIHMDESGFEVETIRPIVMYR